MGFDFGALIVFIVFAAAFAATVIAAILKICGLLLLSWFWVLSPIPAIALIWVLFEGVASICKL